MFRIKICGITNVGDARLAADAGADAIGLNFFSKSRRFVSLQDACSIASAIPNHVVKVGVFVNHAAAEIDEIAKSVPLDIVQLHGDERPTAARTTAKKRRCSAAHRCNRDGLAALAEFLDECRNLGRMPNAVLVDADAGSEYGGTGQVADWSRIAKERATLAGLPLILAGGLTAANVSAAIAAVWPDAVDVASGVERMPGVKDEQLLRKFVAAAKQAFATA